MSTHSYLIQPFIQQIFFKDPMGVMKYEEYWKFRSTYDYDKTIPLRSFNTIKEGKKNRGC